MVHTIIRTSITGRTGSYIPTIKHIRLRDGYGALLRLVAPARPSWHAYLYIAARLLTVALLFYVRLITVDILHILSG